MKAAVVRTFAEPPRYEEFAEPEAAADEVVVEVKAAALSQLVRAQAAGTHYSAIAPPFVPGSDGVGRLASGERVYFAFSRRPFGTMAERSVVARHLTVPLGEHVDDVLAAAIANPGMSSWAALTTRAGLVRGETVWVNGATGVSGRLGVAIARHLGAARVVATGRNAKALAALLQGGADAVISLDQEPAALAEAFRRENAQHGVDVVLDYVWGNSAVAMLEVLGGHGVGHAEKRVRFVQIGSMSGGTIPLAGSVLRSSGLELLGSGLGSVSKPDLVKAVGGVLGAIGDAGLRIGVEPMRLRDVAAAWLWSGDKRVVLTT